jgi:hypothetical protein
MVTILMHDLHTELNLVRFQALQDCSVVLIHTATADMTDIHPEARPC